MRGGRRGLGTGVAMAAMAAALVVSVARADGATAEQLIAIAEQNGMTCQQVDPSLEQCGLLQTGGLQWAVDIRPASGAVTGLTTGAHTTIAPLDGSSVAMMEALQDPTCTDQKAVETFVARVAALVQSASIGPQTVGTCTMTGGLVAAPRDYAYTVQSVVIQPPTPTPSPTATASPTATVSPSATPAATPTARPTLRPTPFPMATVTTSPTASVTATPTTSPIASPEGAVAAATGSPAPPASAADANRFGGLGFARSVAAPSEVRFDAASVTASGLLALFLLLVMAFPGELFNSTVESNYDEIAGWLRRLRIRGLAVVWRGPLGVVLLLGLGALVYSLLDPEFGTDPASAGSYLGLLLGLVVVLVTFELPGLLMHRRRTGELGALRALPWTLVAGGVCVLASRLAGFEPGYLYGVLLGVVFRRPQPEEDEGRQAAAGALFTLVAALAAWGALGWLRTTLVEADMLRVVGETALAAVVVAGLEAVAFGMLPFRFLSGAAVRDWSRPAWALLFGAGAFAFVQVLIGPQSGYLADLAPSGLVAALGVFVAFALLSFATWGFFRFRPARAEE